MATSWKDVQGTVAAIAKEVQPNGGGSLADAVRRTESAMREHGAALQEVRGILRVQADFSEDGAFQCNPAGSFSFVNLPLARLLGVGKDELKEHRWKNFISPQDVARFLTEMGAALAEHRPFNGRCRMVRSDGDLIEVDVTMYPDPERPPAERWFGKIREVQP